jgi:hypothetical protein
MSKARSSFHWSIHDGPLRDPLPEDHVSLENPLGRRFARASAPSRAGLFASGCGLIERRAGLAGPHDAVALFEVGVRR